ncbi:hypothetical protein IV203_014593 [Nitzschia inconspicua]|uniref:Uncharacterized protein n=1 Tax=Nitzschia inconspicua TaxID=303405 RepID=A0A9K3LC61_9STRA|nr:hypothetical protein IV203_014593 [Nitzschia inconspicua]
MSDDLLTVNDDWEGDIYSFEDEDLVENSRTFLNNGASDVAAAMKAHLRTHNEAVTIMSTKYLYMNEDMGWVLLSSTAAARKVCDIMGLYAPVNYAIAAKPVLDILQYHEFPTVVIGITFSQGNVRCRITDKAIDPNNGCTIVTLSVATPMNDVKMKDGEHILYTAKGSYCYCPLKLRKILKKLTIPPMVSAHKRGSMCQWIYDVFEEDTKTVLWLIGDMMADFGTKRLFIIYGPGGVGKTTVVNMIAGISSSVIVEVPGRYMAKRRSGPRNYGNSLSTEMKMNLANTRLALIGDVEVTNSDEHLNMQTVKELTGGDEGPYGKVSVTSIMSCNKLFKYDAMNEYTRPDRIRRVVVIPTVTNRRTENRHYEEGSDNDKAQLIAMSMAVRIKYDMRPPLSARAVLMTLFQAKFTYALSLVCIDDKSTVPENYAATRVLCHKFNISEYTMQQCLKTIGLDCCKVFRDVYVIAHITLRHKAKVWPEGFEGNTSSDKGGHSNRRLRNSEPEVDILSLI